MNREIHQIGQVTVIRVKGALRTEEMLVNGEEFAELLDAGRRAFVFNLIDLVHLGSSSLGAILQCHKLAEEKDASIRLAVSPGQLRLIQITKLDEIFEAYTSEEEALTGTEKT